mgnify:FL=1
MLLDEFQSTFSCIGCRSPLARDGDQFVCRRCGAVYPVREGKLWAVSADVLAAYERETKESFESRWKRLLRNFPRLYIVLEYLFAPGGVPGGLAVRHALRRVPPETRLIVNLGSGSKRIRYDSGILNLDVVPVAEVDVVADMAELPFGDGTLDMVISECALEHVPKAPQAITEIARVVRPGGFLYVVVPFLYPFHEAPNDYFRWTKSGLIAALSDFEPVEVGVWSGPMTTLIGYAAALFAAAFSFGSNRLATVLTYSILIPLAPLKLLDPLFRPFPRISDVSAIVYFFGRRK